MTPVTVGAGLTAAGIIAGTMVGLFYSSQLGFRCKPTLSISSDAYSPT